MSERKPVTVRFRFNKDTGRIERFEIDDNDPAASEAYHDRIARAIAGRLFRNPQVQDIAVPEADSEPETPATEQAPVRREGERQ